MKTRSQILIILSVSLFLFSCKKDSNSSTTDTKLTDIDGNVYDIIKIGTQTWMLENLKVTHYNDGSTIPNVADSALWANTSTGAYCFYNNDSANNSIYGKLYNWYAISTGKLAPAGWHVATDAEWTTLTTFLGGDSIAGNKMKATTLWTSFSGIANTNSSGFTGLPGGLRSSFNSKFYSLGRIAYFWSSTEYTSLIAWSRFLDYSTSAATKDNSGKKDGNSVRCVKD